MNDETRDAASDRADDEDAQATEQQNEAKELEQVQVLPLVALRDTVIFPEMIVPLQVGRDKSIQALNKAVADSSPIALVTQRQADREDIGDPAELYAVGTLAKIAQVVQLQDGTVRAIVQGQE
ncbi:MAG TPA: LON peptidase substrate-binding domain-containing protein, partial [Candidatus Limnocylindria bacterium]